MDNFQPSTVKRLVQFMYTGDYDDPEDNRPGALASQEATQDRPTCTAADAAGIEDTEAANFPEHHANWSTDEGMGLKVLRTLLSHCRCRNQMQLPCF